MANSEAMYFKAPVDGVDSQHSNRSRAFKVGIALIGGSCLALLAVMAMSASGPTTAAGSTSLFGLPTSLRATKPATMRPGVNAWKSLALSTMDAANGCVRDVSADALFKMMNAARMDPAPPPGVDSASIERTDEKDGLQRGIDFPNFIPGAGTLAIDGSTSDAKLEAEAMAKAAIGVKAQELLSAGQVAPLGFFDPLGLSAETTEGRLLFYREAEIKHGRICMLAVLGAFVGEQFHPLFGGNVDVIAAKHFVTLPTDTSELGFWQAAFFQNLAALSFFEITKSLPTIYIPEGADFQGYDAFSMKAGTGRIPGDMGFDPLGLKPKTDKDFLSMQNKEILNGRLAMIAAAGLIAQEVVTGQKVFG